MFEEVVTPYLAVDKTVHQVSRSNHRGLLTKLAKLAKLANVTNLAKEDLMERNPFKPSAGSNPPFLVGRAELVDEFIESIEDGPGAPGRISIFTGPRGIGKTVMLNAVAERVESEFQWTVIHDTATLGLASRLTIKAQRKLRELVPRKAGITGINVAAVGSVNLSSPDPLPDPDLREALTQLVAHLQSKETGLLVTVDEIHAAELPDLIDFSATIQHMVRENREIAVAMAGLPSGVNSLLDQKSTTFLRRAERHHLEKLSDNEVEAALLTTILDSGRTITPEALATATRATGGYPFMVQLVGYQTWRRAKNGIIDIEHARNGIAAAQQRLGHLVHATALRDLSPMDKDFLLAMAQHPSPSSINDLADRLKKTTSYISVYKQRLVEAGLIATDDRGYVEFVVPYMREYLIEHNTSAADKRTPED